MKPMLPRLLTGLLLLMPLARGEALLQYFNVGWAEVARKMPELAEAGYDSLWLPPPTKASGGLSVGYDLWDPFDLGSKDQRGSLRTRYGTEAELLHMVETAHRFGIRVYFDNIMNHRAFDVPGYNENTPIDLYPGMVPEDFHLRKTEDGFYRKWDNTRDWGSTWQVQHLGLADLIDIAHETPNGNFGTSEGSVHPKYSFVRDLERPEQYDRDKDGGTKYFGWLLDRARAELGPSADAEQLRQHARAYLLEHKSAYTEDVGAYLIRAVRWKMNRTRADGLRLDAVKHVPDYFFGQQSGANKDASDAGYLGGVQRQFNLTRGFSDANHRDSVFEEKRPRDDAMVFGEHLGQPPGYGGYFDAGMRLVDNDLRGKLNGTLGNPGASLYGLDSSGAGGFPAALGVTHANSHDSDFAAQKEWQHAFYMTREGMGLIYSDGYNKAETLGESGGAFPRHANTNYLGQFGDPRIPNILRIHQDFARGLQEGRWADGDFLAFERRDNRNPDGSTRSGTAAGEITMVMMMNDNTAQGQARAFSSSFPSGAYLHQYARGPNGSGMTGFYKYANELSSVIVPPGGYFVFSYRTPEPSVLWTDDVITFHQNGVEVPRITVTRSDGRDGDPVFNPLGLSNRGYPAGVTPVARSYRTTVPIVKGGAPMTILARADGSAENILLKLDGGVDLNGTRPSGVTDPAFRDHPPGLRTDTWLGYEQPAFLDRQHAEKFAAKDTTRCRIGSAGAETYIKTIGGAVQINPGPAGENNYQTGPTNAAGQVFVSGVFASWIYHDPQDSVGGITNPPKQLDESGSNLVLWAKSNAVGLGFKKFVYYTLDGSFPEGAGGIGRGTTRVAELNYKHKQGSDDWWGSANIPKPAAGTVFTYKIGSFKNEGSGAPSWWPGSPEAVDYKRRMLSTYRVADFDPSAVVHFPHNDYVRVPTPGLPYAEWPFATRSGLAEGFHVLRARAFLSRGAGEAPLYQTFTRTFYYDASTPEGSIAFPQTDQQTIGGSSYEFVVRTDMTVDEVWYRIADTDAGNDDGQTGQANGNGAGFEPFTDSNRNGVRDDGEEFTDINGNGVHDAALAVTWARATEVTPSPSITSPYPREWRFRYNNIPSSGAGTVTVRLLEPSSSRDLTQSAAAAHARELVRQVQTRGPDERVNIAWPQRDGDRVGDDYVMKVYFSKALADGTTTESLKQRFTFSIASQTSASPDGAVVQDRANFTINYNVSDSFHELAIPLPNLYNDVADFLHTLRVVYRFPDGRERDAVRLVTSNPSSRPFVRIIRPTEVGSDGKPTEIILPDGPGPDTLPFVVQVETSTSVTTAPVLTGITTTGTPTLTTSTTGKTWDYLWNITAPGAYPIQATVSVNGQSTTALRTARVILRQIVDSDLTQDNDDDHDGLVDIDETNRKPLPVTNAETWTNGDVHIHRASGRSLPTSPDSDGDGLPDGLEVGWRVALSPPTDTSVDTNADGIPNFIGDLDPPLYAVVENHSFVPGVGSQSAGDDRARQAAGSVSDPMNPDSDGDGIPDGVEDANRNGWTEGDGKALPVGATRQQYVTHRPNPSDWPDAVMQGSETWLETSPVNPDSDGDGLSDGYGEDKDFDGRITGDANGNRLWQSGEFWTETDPLKADTDGDGLPDGWESFFGLNPLDNGTVAFDGGLADVANGASGDPDGDGLTNLQELTAGTDPRRDNSIVQTAGEAILIGPVGDDDRVVRGAVVNRREFTDWTIDDLVVLDEFQGDGTNHAGGDTYPANDGHDTSRDIVAFYARDGGDVSVGGTGEFYFRVDFHDLKPFAEEGNLDVYVVVDTGNPNVGEYALPDDVDTGTRMRWEAVVCAQQSNRGAVYVDTNRTSNSGTIGENLSTRGVVRRSQNAPDGFRKAYFDSRLDAVEFSIARKALTDAGWLGDPATLNFQVFTTRDGTANSPVGAGDIGGRSDIRDSIYDDWIASDYWRDQPFISLNSELRSWFGYNGPDRGKRAKLMMLAHGNEPMLAASEIQQRLCDAASAQALAAGDSTGYHRPIDAHDAFDAKLGLHITPALAASIQWAAADPSSGKPWRDGPMFNQRVSSLAERSVVELIASTFADSPLPYFDSAWLQDNVALSNRTLAGIYGIQPSPRVFWIPERIIDEGVLSKVSALGYTHVFADQFRHILDRYGRGSALTEDGYRVNRINNLRTIVINDQASAFRFRNTDGGLDISLRQLASRRARSGQQHQLLVFYSDLADFRSKANADAYDRNLAWLASRPWIDLVGPDQVAAGQVDLSVPPDGVGDVFSAVERGTTSFGRKLGPLWLDHATQGNYDHWWFGSATEESLRDKVFEIRPGVPIARASGDSFFGVQSFNGSGAGIARDAWNTLSLLPDSPLGRTGRAAYHASMHLAAWHDEDNNDLSTFSTGDFINADSTYDRLAGFARKAQSQTRIAAVHAAVAAWAASPPSATEAVSADVDLDGEPEFLLRHARVFAVFEAAGGRCTGAWRRDPVSGRVTGVIGNPLAHPCTETEEEGTANRNADGSILARKTSGFKDLWAVSNGTGSSRFVNPIHTVTSAASGDGWTFTSSDGALIKTITLPSGRDELVADYSLSGGISKLYLRFGLSPDPEDLLLRGQQGLSLIMDAASARLVNTTADGDVPVVVSAGTGALIQTAATDDDLGEYDSVNMRNQSLVQQVEVEGAAPQFRVTLSLAEDGAEPPPIDADGDGLPDTWELANGLDPGNASGANGADGDPDSDGLVNLAEWLMGLQPLVADASLQPRILITRIASGFRLEFPTLPGRSYQLQVSDSLATWVDQGNPHVSPPAADAGPHVIEVPAADDARFFRVRIRAAE